MSYATSPAVSVTSDTDHAPTLVLNHDQDIAAKRITNFLLDPNQTNLILRGYAGTGKSTLLKHVIDSLPAIVKLAEITGCNDALQHMTLAATTNKAAGALRQTTQQSACTVHSLLKLRPERNSEGKRQLISTYNTSVLSNQLLIIDEAYMADLDLLRLIDHFTDNCKILWVGDPAQLLPVGMNYCPLAIQEYPEVSLETVIRQAADSPIIQLATLCRYMVNTGRFFKFKPDGEIIKHVPRSLFGKLMLNAHDQHRANPGAVKTLAWTNRCAIGWNNHVKKQITGSIDISVGDYVVCNQAVINHHCNIKTDQTVQVTGKSAMQKMFGVDGHMYELDERHSAFMPVSLDDKKACLKALKKDGTPEAIKRQHSIEDNWIDLRDEYACTVTKSQGSTYGTTFIDLDDISRCNQINQLARLLYVAISRPKDKIVFTGDVHK